MSASLDTACSSVLPEDKPDTACSSLLPEDKPSTPKKVNQAAMVSTILRSLAARRGPKPQKHVQWTATACERSFDRDSTLNEFVAERQTNLPKIGQEVASKQRILAKQAALRVDVSRTPPAAGPPQSLMTEFLSVIERASQPHGLHGYKLAVRPPVTTGTKPTQPPPPIPAHALKPPATTDLKYLRPLPQPVFHRTTAAWVPPKPPVKRSTKGPFIQFEQTLHTQVAQVLSWGGSVRA